MRGGETELSLHLDTSNGRLAMVYILNRWIELRAAGFAENPGDRLAYREMCYALHSTTSAAPLPQ